MIKGNALNLIFFLKTNTVTPIETIFYKHNEEHFLFLFQMDDFSTMQGVVLVSQRLVLLLLEESFLCLPLRQAEWGFPLNLLSRSRQTLLVKREYQCSAEKHRLYPVDHFPIRIQHRPDQQTPDARLCPSLLVHLRLKVLCPSFHVFLAGWG